jgi:hypothetical protein
MNGRRGEGPSEDERLNPGETDPNPTGKSAPAPAEGADDNSPPEAGSPER